MLHRLKKKANIEMIHSLIAMLLLLCFFFINNRIKFNNISKSHYIYLSKWKREKIVFFSKKKQTKKRTQPKISERQMTDAHCTG